jgi:hypothetical protein
MSGSGRRGGSARPRFRRGRELPLLDGFEEKRQGLHEDLAGIAIRDLGTQEILEAPELVFCLRPDRELDRYRSGESGPNTDRAVGALGGKEIAEVAINSIGGLTASFVGDEISRG